MDTLEDLTTEELQKNLMLLPENNAPRLKEIKHINKDGLIKLMKILRNIPDFTIDELNCALKLPPEKNIDELSREDLLEYALNYNIKSNLKIKDNEEIRRMIRRSRIWRSEEIERLEEQKALESSQTKIKGIDESISLHKDFISSRTLLEGGGKKRRRKKQSKRRSKKRRSKKRRSSKRRSKKY